jgi:predicted metal-dependent HD superfamily phosphohydrolase
MVVDKQLLAAAESYARHALTQDLDERYVYHTLAHTEQVVEASTQIGQAAHLTQEEIDLIRLAAWFHDLGYLNRYIGHEEESRLIAMRFLKAHGAEERLIHAVDELIDSTRMDQEPRNALEEVLKDADLYNLATPEALENSQKIRQEWAAFCDREFSDEDWDAFNYQFFKDHEYFTHHGREQLEPLKQENLRRLKKAIKKRRREAEETARSVLLVQLEQQETKVEELRKKIKKIRKQRPERGIETMFRTTYRTHISLSDLADNKANILLTVNGVVISIVLTKLVDAISIQQWKLSFVLPVVAFLLVSMVTLVFAILTTRPKINSGRFTREDILEKKTNLLFFGNFYRMSMDDYLWGINEMMKDADYLYGSMSKDIYFLGKVLAQKFFYLRMAYNIFMYGTGVCILIFLITYLFTY